ncbi:hypothetical protein FQV27_11180 [Paracoccus aurantiacus]|uniref:Uncharacterized protein n=1 Tax=Paracoccus aurantiacus TaxID=2599412 RepID=A0A5C6S2R3_9RHOB|nr:hypothetical protein [Paracoccus aurantiacus]TXB68546.1 hypothetical protein FQV27_11180 [Paracoccus aurantiacus]
MRYHSGHDIRMGDRVSMSGRPGVVVFSIDHDEFSPGYSREDWASLASGVMLDVAGWGLVHMHGPPDLDLELISRAK